MEYPNTRRDPTVIEDYHGTKVADPYRWLEDPDSDETQQWVKAQNAVTQSLFSKLHDREKFFKRLKEVRDYVEVGTPFREGDNWFYWKNTGLQNQHVLYINKTKEFTSFDEGNVFLDPNLLSADGTTAVSGSTFSDDGKHFAYSLSKAGSDWCTIKFKEIISTEEFKDLEDHLEYVKFSSLQWTKDGKGFFYCKYPPPSVANNTEEAKLGTETEANKNQQVFFHRLGTKQSEDRLIYFDEKEPLWMYGAELSDDFEYLFITISQDCDKSRKFYYVKWAEEANKQGMIVPVKLIDQFEAEYTYVTNEGSTLYIYTNKDAPKNRLVKLDLTDAFDAEGKRKPLNLVDILPQTENVLQWAYPINKKFFLASYLKDVTEVLHLYDMEGKLVKDFGLPIGTIASIHARKARNVFFFKFISFLSPGTIYKYSFEDEQLKVFHQIQVKGIDLSALTTEQIFYKSDDGTRIPMFVIKNKNLVPNGENPTILYGYGGFNISISPSFSASRLLWVHHYNSVFAVANIRGGDEYGEEWHQGGILNRKQNVFNDFKAAARALIEHKYTKAEKIAINGGSNGGLLVAACTNQSPELFGCAVAQVGVLDMLRFHKFTIGYAWTSDYGCADKPEDFEYLIKYSPLHNVHKGKQYPSLLLMTADHDDRVVPLHSFKYISEVQYQLGKEEYQKNPLLIRIEEKAGHGAGKPMSKILEEAADMYAFIAHSLGATWKD